MTEMLSDWWTAHRFEFALVVPAVLLLGFAVFIFKPKRQRR